ncbi:MAG: hypothetical protein L3J39_04585 [Verrucomicrobiales bacterium]|nr:hypothetical protein [Verrucomicrobiales bacterium]
MHTRLGKIRYRITMVLCVSFALVIKTQAQKAAALEGKAAPESQTRKANLEEKAPAKESSAKDTATTSALDYLFNRKAKDGSTAAKGSKLADALGTKAIADEALQGISSDIDPEFESFLNAPEQNLQLVESYGELLDETVAHLRNKKAYDAIANLYVLGRYSWDARISEQLANRVMALRDARMSQQDLEKSNKELEGKIKKANWNADQLSTKIRQEEIDYQRRQSLSSRKAAQKNQKSQNGGKNSAFLPNQEMSQQAVSSVMGRLQLTEEYFKSLDSRARIRLNESEVKKIETKARRDFQEFVGVLYQGQRHHHARLAADFYRVLFGDGDLPAEMASQATAASEIIGRVKDDVEVFKFKASKGQLATAAKMLQETFSLSRRHPALRSINREEKLKVADYLGELQKLKNMIEARDFEKLDKALNQLEQEISDFDATKPRALVNAVKRESDMRLGMAKLAAQQGDLEKAMEEFRAAAQGWPGNPKLQDASEQFFSTQDVMNKSNEEFDQAFAADNYRLIFKKKLAFAVAVRGDDERERQLKKALETVQSAEFAREKAKLLERSLDPFGAWEALEIAAEDWPDDPALNRRRADLAVRASEFVSAVTKARDGEEAGDFGYSLSWFLNAQSRYPASLFANDGIKRVTDRVLGKPVPEDRSAAGEDEDKKNEAESEDEVKKDVGLEAQGKQG